MESPSWQKWTIENLTKSIEHGQFQGNKVIAALPPSEMFIDTIKISQKVESKTDDIIRDHLKRKNITPENMLIKNISIEYFYT